MDIGQFLGHVLDHVASHPPARHLEGVAACKRLLAAGETYEVCLTNRVETGPVADPLALYRALRRVNPAPRTTASRMTASRLSCRIRAQMSSFLHVP